MTSEGLTLAADQIATVKRHVAFANELSGKREFSWSRFLSDFEDALPARISINSIHLNFQDSTVNVQGSARTLQDLSAMVARVQSHKSFRNAILANHRLVEGKGTAAGVSRQSATGAPPSMPSDGHVEFQMTVVYRPSL